MIFLALLFLIAGGALVAEGLRPGSVTTVFNRVRFAVGGGKDREALLWELQAAHVRFLNRWSTLVNHLTARSGLGTFLDQLALGAALAVALTTSPQLAVKTLKLGQALSDLATYQDYSAEAKAADAALAEVRRLESALGFEPGTTTYQSVLDEYWTLRHLRE